MVNEIALTILLSLAAVCWYHRQRLMERALALAQARCRTAGVQLLDGYVALESVRLVRGPVGNWQWRARFSFEFTATGEDRYPGGLVMHGLRLASFQLPPHRIGADQAAPAKDCL